MPKNLGGLERTTGYAFLITISLASVALWLFKLMKHFIVGLNLPYS
ncbi:MAG: hypothetical protein M1495_15100 [Bacteroidetes bacterium]|nr:hypothetical protein [Bacteroidota bacterium]MCL6098495.1 hypothetical protein [Bacteroidota bacterium]